MLAKEFQDRFLRDTGVMADIDLSKRGWQKIRCPYCDASRSDKKDKSMRLNLTTGYYKCHYCEEKSRVFPDNSTENSAENSTENKETYSQQHAYKSPARTFETIGDEAHLYLSGRGISDEVISMPIVASVSKKQGGTYLCFNYFKDGRHIYTKYRGIKEKKFFAEADCEQGLYNGDVLKSDPTYLIITEGEIEVLSWITAGYPAAVSVPNGANTNLSYLDEYMPQIEKVDRVYIATDDDEKGNDLRQVLADKIGKEKCYSVTFYGEKDGNDLLQSDGVAGLREALKDAEFMGEVYNREAIAKAVDLLVITNSRVDAAAYSEAGFLAIGIPDKGADTSYLDPYIDEIIEIGKNGRIVLSFSGKDIVVLTKSITARVGRELCSYIETSKPVTPTNATAMISAAKEVPIDGVREIKDFFNEAFEYLTRGYPETYPPNIPGFPGRWSLHFGEVTIITGAPSAGKSNLADLLVVDYARDHGFKSAVVSAEKTGGLYSSGLARKYLQSAEVTPNAAVQSLAFLDEHVFYLEGKKVEGGPEWQKAGLHYLDDILDKMRSLVISKGAKILLIDNLSCVSDRRGKDEGDGDFVSRTMGKIQGFAKYYNVAVILVAHPRKQSLDAVTGFFNLPTGYDILGSSHYYNLVDNIIAMAKQGEGSVRIGTRKIRNKEFVGRESEWNLTFLEEKGGIYGPGEHGQKSDGGWRTSSVESISSFLNEE